MLKSFVFSVFFLSAATAVWAAPQITISTEYYDVRGLTSAEIRANTQAHQKKTHNFGGCDALTEGKLRWVGEPPVVHMDIVYKMPRWVDYDQGSAELKARWDRYYKALQFHEEGHRRICEAEAQAAEQMMQTADRRSRTFNRDMNILYQNYDKQQIAYDKETRHGQNQGVIFEVTEAPPKGMAQAQRREEQQQKREREAKLREEWNRRYGSR